MKILISATDILRKKFSLTELLQSDQRVHHKAFQLKEEQSMETLGVTQEEYELYKRMIDHLPTGLIQGGSFPNMVEKLWKYRKYVSSKQYGRILLILTGRLLFEPFRFIDQMYTRDIGKTRIEHPPLFIMGMYRSGTTHLHNLISLNALLAFATNQQVANPESFISGNILHQFVAKAYTPKERPFDPMKVYPDSPQEHQFAMLNMLTPVYSDSFLFPSKYKELLDLSVIKELPEVLQTMWKQKFVYLLQKLTYVNKGKQLVLKNPHDTANIASLLELFPNAKFIFIHREPEKVLPSLINTFRALIYGLQLEGKPFTKLKPEAIHYFKHVLTPIATDSTFIVYKKLMEQYFKEKHLIPKGNLFELRYDELIHDPIHVIMQIHHVLNIRIDPNYEKTLKGYLNSIEQEKYKTNKFAPLPDNIKARLHSELEFVYEKLGYKKQHGN